LLKKRLVHGGRAFPATMRPGGESDKNFDSTQKVQGKFELKITCGNKLFWQEGWGNAIVKSAREVRDSSLSKHPLSPHHIDLS